MIGSNTNRIRYSVYIMYVYKLSRVILESCKGNGCKL